MSDTTFYLAKCSAQDTQDALKQLRDCVGELDFELNALNDDPDIQANPKHLVRVIALRTAAQTAVHELSKFEKSIDEFEEFCRNGNDND